MFISVIEPQHPHYDENVNEETTGILIEVKTAMIEAFNSAIKEVMSKNQTATEEQRATIETALLNELEPQLPIEFESQLSVEENQKLPVDGLDNSTDGQKIEKRTRHKTKKYT